MTGRLIREGAFKEKLLHHLKSCKFKFSSRLTHREKRDGWITDAGTELGGYYTTVAEWDEIDYEKLVEEIDKFSKKFNSETKSNE